MKVLMRERGVSNNALAGKVGVSEATIRQAINLGVGRLGADTIYKIARELGATVESLLEEPDLHSGGQALDRLPVRYRVGGGAWVEVDDYAQGDYGAIEISPDPRFPFNMQWLEQVEGDSMNRIYPEGTYLHVVDAIYLGYEPKEGDVVIVERSRDGGLLKERSAKQVHVRRGGNRPLAKIYKSEVENRDYDR